MEKQIFEVSKHMGDFCVVANDYDNLELMIVFYGSQRECEELVERLTEAQCRGFLKAI